jgi:hypothetical protein
MIFKRNQKAALYSSPLLFIEKGGRIGRLFLSTLWFDSRGPIPIHVADAKAPMPKSEQKAIRKGNQS